MAEKKSKSEGKKKPVRRASAKLVPLMEHGVLTEAGKKRYQPKKPAAKKA